MSTTGKDLAFLLESMKSKNKRVVVRYHIYAVIEQRPGDHPVLDEVLESIQGYGNADVIHVEVVDEKKGS